MMICNKQLTGFSLLLQSKNKQRLSSYGGPNGLARMLGSSELQGLDPGASGGFSLESRREMYGANRFKERKTKGLLLLVFEQLKDPTLILLMVAAAVSLHNEPCYHCLGSSSRRHNKWILVTSQDATSRETFV